MKYEREDRFPENLRVAIDGVARVVAYVYGIGIEDIRNKSRRRISTDARKMVCLYVNDNLRLNTQGTYRRLALSAWYFNCDHSTVHYGIDSARELYSRDSNFARVYDAVVEFIDNPKYTPDFTYSDLYSNKKTWDDVRMNINELHRVRYSFMPQYIKEDIISLYNKGYGEFTIAEKVGTTLDFINYFVEREKLTRNKMDKLNKAILEARIKFNKAMEVYY